MPWRSLALLWVLFSSSQQPAGVIEGRIVNAMGGAPVANAQVEARRIGDDALPFLVQSANDGSFAIGNLPQGEYRLVAKHTGFVDGEYGQQAVSGRGTAIRLSGADRVAANSIELTPTAAFHGRVIGGDGRPFVKASVQALKVTYRNGQRTLSPVQTAITDDLGEYRIFWLMPGQYYVSASAPDWGRLGDYIVLGSGPKPASTANSSRYFQSPGDPLAAATGGLPSAAVRYAPVYYPNTSDETAAQTVNLAPGADLPNINFQLGPVRTRRIRGTVVDADTGLPATSSPGLVIQLRSSPSLDGASSAANPNGEFDMPIAPAATTVSATSNSKAGRISIPAGENDVNGLRVLIHSGFNITGKVLVDAQPGSALAIAGMRVVVRGDPQVLTTRGSPDSGIVSGDGVFTLENLSAGDYRVEVLPPPNAAASSLNSDGFFRSIRYGGADVLNGSLQLVGPPAPGETIEIVMSNRWGSLSGDVMDTNGKPKAAITVLAVPDLAHRQRADLFKNVTTDDAGEFDLNRLPPGNYKLFAWEDIEQGIWNDPNFLATYESRGIEVRIIEGVNPATTLSVIATSPRK